VNDHDRYADWDGAYVLGALAPAERAEYERHLADCYTCQDAVGELAPLPGLLARVDTDTLEAIDELPPADLERRLLAAARPPWWRRTSGRVGLGLAAAAAVVAAVVLPVTLAGGPADHPASDRTVQVALHPSAEAPTSPLSAEVGLAAEHWGTQVDMTCRYAAGGTSYGSRSYALYVVDAAGHDQLVSTWHSGPGDVARTTGATDLALADITRVELRDVASGAVLLSGAAG
jgi:hypothetical protein